MGDDSALKPSIQAFYQGLSGTGLVRRLLEIARDEDLGPNRTDLTASVTKSETEQSSARVVLGQDAVVAGLAVIPELLEVFGAEVDVSLASSDGDRAAKGAELATLEGPLDQIVTIERTILNLLGRLTGVATLTSEYVKQTGPGVEVLDTRKTTPGLRVLEKYAVRCGGGTSHRLGLHDAVLIKDNHIAHVPNDELVSWISDAAQRADELSCAFFMVEVDTLDQFRQVLRVDDGLVDYVLLDNMSPEMMRTAVGIRDDSGSSIRLEASGGVRLETIASIAASGVERISVGALTHQAVTADVRLDIGSAR